MCLVMSLEPFEGALKQTVSRRRGVVFAYLLLVAQVVSSLLFTPYLIRSLGQAEYGLFSLVSSITAYFMLLDAGVGNALVRYIAKFRVSNDVEQQNRFLGLSVLFYAGAGIVILLLGLLLRDYLPSIFGGGLTGAELKQAGTMLDITLLNAAMILVVSAFDRTIIAYERFVLSNSLAIAKLVLRVLVLTALLYMGYRAVAVVVVNLVLTVVFGAISVFFVTVRLKLRPVFSGIRFGFLREVLGYSSFIFIQMVATQLNFMSNQVLLGIMTSSVAVGLYAIGALLAQYFQSIAGGINGVLMPGVVRLVENGAKPETLLDEMVKVGRLIFMVLGLILVTFAICGQRFVTLWVGGENAQAYLVALILMTPLALSLSQSIGTQILWAMGRHRIQALVQIGVAVVNVALTVVLIRYWIPVIGASLATAIAYVVGDIVVLNVVFSRDIGISIKRYYAGLLNGIAPSLLVAALAGVLIGLLNTPGWLGLILQGATILAAYTSAMALFGLNRYEKDLLSSLVRKRALPGPRTDPG